MMPYIYAGTHRNSVANRRNRQEEPVEESGLETWTGMQTHLSIYERVQQPLCDMSDEMPMEKS